MLQTIVEQLEACNFQCEAGLLANNEAFIQLKKLADEEKAANDRLAAEIGKRICEQMKNAMCNRASQ